MSFVALRGTSDWSALANDKSTSRLASTTIGRYATLLVPYRTVQPKPWARRVLDYSVCMTQEPRHLLGARLHERAPKVGGDGSAYPFHFPWLTDLNLRFTTPVTFLVGENGSGKSTLLEALAELCGLPAAGGSLAEAGLAYAPESSAALASALRPAFRHRPRDGYFFRAEHQAHLAALLEDRERDPDFQEDPYRHYGGRSLLHRSHGEAFLALMQHRLQSGLVLMDEPESALSPERQLALLALMADRVDRLNAQFIIATHSPILMTYPGATILSFDDEALEPIRLEDTVHFQITHGILNHPERYWKHLRSTT